MKIKMFFFELRNRLFLLFLLWLTVVLVCYVFKETLLFNIIKQSSCFEEPLYFIFTDVAEIFYVYISLIFFIGNQVFLFYFFYHVIVFLNPGLFYSEYLNFVFIFKLSISWFIFSVFTYSTVFFPFCWDFFLSFQNLNSLLNTTTLYFESKISEYLIFYISFYYLYVFYFQVLVLLFLVFDFYKTKKELTKNFRKFFYYFFIIFSTLITPPDVFSQLFLSLCLIFSYEILVFYFIYKKVIK